MIDINDITKTVKEWMREHAIDDGVAESGAADIIASLHNELHNLVTGAYYDYMFHWANKCGGWCEDDLFKNERDKESHFIKIDNDIFKIEEG